MQSELEIVRDWQQPAFSGFSSRQPAASRSAGRGSSETGGVASKGGCLDLRLADRRRNASEPDSGLNDPRGTARTEQTGAVASVIRTDPGGI